MTKDVTDVTKDVTCVTSHYLFYLDKKKKHKSKMFKFIFTISDIIVTINLVLRLCLTYLVYHMITYTTSYRYIS